MSDKDDIAGKTAGDFIRSEVVSFMFGSKRGQIPLKKLRTRLNQSLDAKMTKVFNDKESGVVYSRDLVDNKTRLAAQKLAHDLLGTTKETVEHEHTGELVIKWQE
jgi:hypothetical protein